MLRSVQHAFAKPNSCFALSGNPDNQRLVPHQQLFRNRGDVALIVLCLPPVLLATWLCSIQHNWQRGSAAVKSAAGLGPPARPPLFLAGTAAGLVIVVIVTATGGIDVMRAAFAQPVLWIVICLPELAWVGPLAIALILLLLPHARRTGSSEVPRPPSAF